MLLLADVQLRVNVPVVLDSGPDSVDEGGISTTVTATALLALQPDALQAKLFPTPFSRENEPDPFSATALSNPVHRSTLRFMGLDANHSIYASYRRLYSIVRIGREALVRDWPLE